MDKKRIYIACLLILALIGIIPLSGCSAEASGEDAALLKEVTLGVWRNDEIIPAVNSFNSQHDQFQIRIVNYDILLYNAAWLRGFIDRKNSCRSITARIIGAAGGYRHSLSNRG